MPSLQETPHRPSRRQAIIFFCFTLVVAAGVIAWVFVLDTGALLVAGEPPFSVRVGGEEVACAETACRLRLKPRTYTVSFLKPGFAEDQVEVSVKRWQETTATATFRFIPVIKDLGELVLPFAGAPIHPPFLGQERLENFPRSGSETLISPEEVHALVHLGREWYLYEFAVHALSETIIPVDAIASWSSEAIVFLVREGEGHALKIVGERTNETIVRFPEAFKSPALSGGAANNFVLIADTLPTEKRFYIVDLEGKSRKRLTLPADAELRFGMSQMVVKQTDPIEGIKKIFLMDSATQTRTEIPARDLENIAERRLGTFIFFTNQKHDPGQAKLGPSISEILDEANRETSEAFSGEELPGKIFLTEFDLERKTFRTLAEIALKAGERVSKLTADPSGEKLYFEKEGRVFEVMLTP